MHPIGIGETGRESIGSTMALYSSMLYPIFESIQEGKTVRDIKHSLRQACATEPNANAFCRYQPNLYCADLCQGEWRQTHTSAIKPKNMSSEI